MSLGKDRDRPHRHPRIAGCDPREIRIFSGGRKPEILPWSDLQSVALESQEPELIGDDSPCWVLRGLLNPGPFWVPTTSKGIEELEKRLRALPGFDMDTYHEAHMATVQR